MNDITIAVISDLHCKHGGSADLISTQTYLTTDLDLTPINRHPIEAIKKMLQDNAIKANFVLCPGDITDKIDKTGLFSGWRYLREIKDLLSANHLYATIGNHDTDSRATHSNPHPLDIIKQLSSQEYPTKSESVNQHFWANHYCINNEEDHCILIFNSCYSHTSSGKSNDSVIGQEIIDSINQDLKKIDLENKVKICLLHHHPDHHSNFDIKFKDSDFVTNGDKLLEILSTHGFNIVVHGHKHEPKLRYFNKLPLFASGSFSSMMNIIDIGAQNTFHLITLSANNRGIIQSWVYRPTKGWVQEEDSYFPSITGFGSTKPVIDIANECNQYFIRESKPYVTFTEIVDHIPDIKHLIPQEQAQLTEMLLEKHELTIYPSIFKKPELIIKLHSK